MRIRDMGRLGDIFCDWTRKYLCRFIVRITAYVLVVDLQLSCVWVKVGIRSVERFKRYVKKDEELVEGEERMGAFGLLLGIIIGMILINGWNEINGYTFIARV
ncbi:hypothetical protein Tco_1020590 [Tanacetum coccineum]